MPGQRRVHCLHIADYVYAFCSLSLTQMCVFISLYVILRIPISVLVCAEQVCSVLVS